MDTDERMCAYSHAQAMPPELVSYILQFVLQGKDLLQCALTCRAWTFHALEALWYKPQFRNNAQWAVFCEILADAGTWAYPYASFVRRINLSSLSTNVHDQHLALLAQCHRIERITLIGCTALTDDGLTGLLSECVGEYVTSVDLSDITTITDQSIFKIAAKCPSLQGLNLSMCHEDQSRCTDVTDASICLIAASCPQLRRIKLSNCTALTVKSAMALARGCPRLLEIDCPVNDEALAEIFLHLKELREYRLQQGESITDAIVRPFYAANVPFELMDEQYRRSVAHGLRRPLEVKAGSFHQLRFLDLSNAAFITDETVRVLVLAAPKIRSLVLNKCKQITDDAVLAICQLHRFLHYLHLGHCELLTDKSIIELAHTCTRIRYLDLAQCSNLTNEAVVALATMPRLKRIGLVKCFNVSDVGIDAFAQNPRMASSLERVHLSYCVKLSEASIRRLLNFCYRLTHLSLTHVPAFLRTELFQFRRAPPKNFSQQQQNVFCVFSGSGVKELRTYLNKSSSSSAARPRPTQQPPTPGAASTTMVFSAAPTTPHPFTPAPVAYALPPPALASGPHHLTPSSSDPVLRRTANNGAMPSSTTPTMGSSSQYPGAAPTDRPYWNFGVPSMGVMLSNGVFLRHNTDWSSQQQDQQPPHALQHMQHQHHPQQPQTPAHTPDPSRPNTPGVITRPNPVTIDDPMEIDDDDDVMMEDERLME